MALSRENRIRILFTITFLAILHVTVLNARDYHVTGTVTDINGNVVPNALVSLTAGTMEFAAKTKNDGTYTLRISGIYEYSTGGLETGIPYPNPFSASVNIPFIINAPGTIRFSVYNFAGQKVYETIFDSIDAGSYHIVWDGCDQKGSPESSGFYFYAITFKSITRSGKLIKASGYSAYSASTAIVPDMMAPATITPPGKFRFPVIASVNCDNYYPVRLTDITIGQDTIIDFELELKQTIPFKTSGNFIAKNTGTEYRSMILKGINLGSSPPGYFPGEIAYAITADQYTSWIQAIADAGFNSIRVYTLHPPVFYEKLANYNQRHPDKPLFLFQGIWLDEVEDNTTESLDLTNRVTAFTKEIHDAIDCIHGKGDIPYGYGVSYGRYLSDLSRWTAGYILGREISPEEVLTTDSLHKSDIAYSGTELSITGATATEVFVTRMLDIAMTYEEQKYLSKRPVSIASWPTLDPLVHPTEPDSEEDEASFDIEKITLINPEPGIFASYHAYPYYPNFVSLQPSYRTFSDSEGPDSYLGYLTDLKSHYSAMPLIIAEFGVPSSWGSAHQSYSNMNHGGYSEQQQGEKDIRLLNNIINSGCAGGFVFSWMDEWFKPTWIVSYLEAYGIVTGDATIPTRQLWLNLASPEENFGLVAFDQTNVLPFVNYETDRPSGPLSKISATNDNSFFYLEIEAGRELSAGDTVMVAFDTYLSSLGESQLPNGKILSNRSEFLLNIVLGQDTALYDVTEAYNMYGLTPRFDLSNHVVQQFKSTVTDGAPWILMKWVNDKFLQSIQDIGKLPVENSSDYTSGQRAAVAWSGTKLKIRIPWTMLYFYDPTQMQVIDGATSYDGGSTYVISTALSDGIGVSVYFDGVVTSSQSRYTWPLWLIVPPTETREKKSYQIITSGMSSIPDFTD